MNSFNQDTFAFSSTFSLSEAEGEVDGTNVLAKIKGEFFFPDAISRNNRFYSRKLWEKTLSNPEVKSRLKERRMFGTISHTQKLDDSALLDGKISHIVTELYIDERGRGIGEAVVLNTPAGRILNTVMRAGAKLYVSTRASGKFNGSYNGVPKVDEESYSLDTVDIVLEPGFLKANPTIVESLMSLTSKGEGDGKIDSVKRLKESPIKPSSPVKSSSNLKEELNMKELVESLSRDKNRMADELAHAVSQVEKLKNENVILSSENGNLRSQVRDLSSKANLSEGYRGLGSPSEISKAFDKAESLLRQYKELGTVREVQEALNRAGALISAYKPLGTPKEVNEALDKSLTMLRGYRALGSVQQVGEALRRSYETLSKFKTFGSVSEVTEAFTKMEAFAGNIKRSKIRERVKKLAEELGVPAKAVFRIYGKMSEKEIRETFASVKESAKVSKQYRKPKNEGRSMTESKAVSKDSPMAQTRVSRLMSSFGR